MNRHPRTLPLQRNCLICGILFKVHQTRLRKGNGKYCSISCGSKGKNRNPRGNIKAVNEWRKENGSWNRGKKYLAISGSKHWNWQGGKTKESLAARASSEYKYWRKQVYERDEYKCVICGYRGNQLIADHIKSFSRYPDLRFALHNGRTLCRECHKLTPNYCGRVRVNIYA